MPPTPGATSEPPSNPPERAATDNAPEPGAAASAAAAPSPAPPADASTAREAAPPPVTRAALPFPDDGPPVPWQQAPASPPLPHVPLQAPGAPIKVLDGSAPLLDYTHGGAAAEPTPRGRRGLHLTGEIPILRDLPFGKGPGYGGETPFALDNPTGRAPVSDDEADGIPTGLPSVLGRLHTVVVADDDDTAPIPVRRSAGDEKTQPPAEATRRTYSDEAADAQRLLAVANRRSRGLTMLGFISGFLCGLLAATVLLGML
jgi:hypothetical protein